MKKLFIAAALALSMPLASCAGFGTTAGQVSTASKQARISANKIYTSASVLGAALVQQGLLSPPEYRRRDNQAYAVLLKVRLGQATLVELAMSAAAIGKVN